MMYQTYQNLEFFSSQFRSFAQSNNISMENYFDGFIPSSLRNLYAINEQVSLMGFTHQSPNFDIKYVIDSNGDEKIVSETLFSSTEFCKLLHFKKENVKGEPKILLVAPMSGHFATLLTCTLKTLLKDHEVYITDWLNIRDIPLSCGKFDFDSYVKNIIYFLEQMGEDVHLMAVCQPTVSALIATAVLSETKSPFTPASLILLAGPIDVRINPTKVNKLANQKSIDWFEKNLISNVPFQCRGVGRKVYPGMLQLSAFMSMNMKRHQESFKKMFMYRKNGKHEAAQVIYDFYKEYFAVMDLSSDFYLETVERIFQKFELVSGLIKYNGQLVNLRAIKKPFLLTIEGERDDICGIGQTLAAQDLCSLLPAYRKTHHLQAGVGHYGVFNGKKWENQIYPVIRNHIQSSL